MIHKIKINERESLNFKPLPEDVGRLQNDISIEKDVSIDELSKLITQPYAYIWTPFHFVGIRNRSNWRSQSIFYLDFDKGTSLTSILNRLSMMSIRPNIVYNTLSDTPNLRKYRIVICIDSVINCPETAYWIQSNLVQMFEDSDQSCKTIERMVYPGFSCLHLDTVENSTEDILHIINSYLISTDVEGKTRKMKSFEMTLLQNDEFEYRVIFDKNKVEVVNREIKLEDNFNWKLGFKEIKILNAFESGVRLKHMEIFGLATNLQYIKGGLLYMKKKMTQVNDNVDRLDISGQPAKKYIHSQFATLSQIRAGKYLPQMLSKFSPFIEDHEYHNIIEGVKFKRGRIDVLKDINRISLNKAERKLASEFKRVYNDIYKRDPFDGDIFNSNDILPNYDNNKVYLFRVATGLGKTKILENIENTLICFPTNNLKKEVSDRMGVTYSMTPDYPVFSDDVINELISSYYGSGLYELSSNVIERISEGRTITINKKVFTPTIDDRDMAKSFRDENMLCRSVGHTVLTTHTRAISDKSFKHNTIIFDECPMSQIISVGQASLNFTIFDNTEFKDDIKEIEDYFRTRLGFNYLQDTPKFTIRNYSGFAEFCALNNRSDIIRLIDSKVVYKDKVIPGIQFASIKPMPQKNIIIMSATAPEAIYRKMFGKSLEVIDIDNIEKVGKVNQHTKKSWSRTSWDKSSESTKKEVYDIIGNKPVITFKSIKGKFKNASKLLHFGNCSGSDELKGQDIVVFGTDNKPTYVYFFYAHILGIDIKGSDNLLSNQIVEWNDFRFRIMTFDNPDLRDIQLSIIESELVQAVGRNRNLRENCETILFSSLPLKISDKFIW